MTLVFMLAGYLTEHPVEVETPEESPRVETSEEEILIDEVEQILRRLTWTLIILLGAGVVWYVLGQLSESSRPENLEGGRLFLREFRIPSAPQIQDLSFNDNHYRSLAKFIVQKVRR